MSELDKHEHTLRPEAVEDILVWACSTLGTNDNVSKLLRLHALTEHYLDRLLALRLINPDMVVEDGRFSYHHKRVLVAALGALPSSIIESLKRLTALRNKCAHSAYPKIVDSDIRDAAQPIKEAFDIAHQDHVKDGVPIDDLGAYAWALFTEITLHITPYEIALAKLAIPNIAVEKDASPQSGSRPSP